MVGGVRNRALIWGAVGAALLLVIIPVRGLLHSAVDTSTGIGWLLYNGVWVLVGLAAVALVVDILSRGRRRASIDINASGVVFRTRAGVGWALGWDALGGLVLTTAYHATRYGNPIRRLRLILMPRGGIPVAVAPQLARWQGRYGAHPSDFGIPVLRYSDLGSLDHSLRQFAGPLYQGVVDEGLVIGFGYD